MFFDFINIPTGSMAEHSKAFCDKSKYDNEWAFTSKRSDGGIIDDKTAGGISIREIGTSMLEPQLITNNTMFNVAFYSCRLSAPITIKAQETAAIYCPVNALRTDRVIVTNQDAFVDILRVLPWGDDFGNVIIWVKNDWDTGSVNFSTYGGFSIMVFTGEREVKGCYGTQAPFC